MSISLSGAVSGNGAEVDATSLGMIVQNPKITTQAGYTAPFVIRDRGSVTGNINGSPLDVSLDSRLKIGFDTPLFCDIFNYSTQNTAIWNINNATMSGTYGGGFFNINSNNDVTTGHYCTAKTYKNFSLYSITGTRVEFVSTWTQVPQAANTIYFGVGLAGTTAAPTDGIYWQLDSTGLLKGVINNNGSILTTGAISNISTNSYNDFIIIISNTKVEFWINGILQNVLAPSYQLPLMESSAPLFMQMTNTGAIATAQQFRTQQVTVLTLDDNISKQYSHIQSGMGLMGYQGQNGGTMGSTSQFANNAFPTAATPTNTTAALGNGLGGLFLSNANLAIGTDGIISSWQNPAGGMNQTARNLVITGLNIDNTIYTTLGGTSFSLLWGLAFGHTSVSLATAESATTKQPRRIALGMHFPLGTAVGSGFSQGNHLYQEFHAPIVIQPGEFIQTFIRYIGTSPSTGSILHAIMFDSYFD